jgi:crossover junction endodeoxyribonuclease RuvC
MIFLGIDPGKSGGIGMVKKWPDDSILIEHFKLDATEKDITDWLRERTRLSTCAVIEKVSSSPQMGVTSAFSFGRSFGFLLGALAALEIPYALVTPQKWQKAMGCMSKGDKNVTKAAAQRLYPNEKITHATADALLLATYCRRHHTELF